jgi:hypothetical protein
MFSVISTAQTKKKKSKPLQIRARAKLRETKEK